MADRKNLLGCSQEELEKFFLDIDEPSFRAKQLLKWVHQKGELDFANMSNFNKPLREKMKEIAVLVPPELKKVLVSEDGTKKYLIQLDSGSSIEMVRIPEKKRITLCISSQAGCALQCTFCATGAQGFEKNLTSDEIIGQLWLANFHDKTDTPITNVVFMGMGEPLLNFEPVITSAEIMRNESAYFLSKKRITISTAGLVPQIKKLADRTDVSLAISLHAADDNLRDIIVPINKKYPIDELLDACKNYLTLHEDKRHVTIEYILIDGVNDSMDHAKSLGKILSGLPCKINLIPFNPFDGCDYKRSNDRNIEAFKKHLFDKGYITTLRVTRGDDIDGACGQLVGNLKKATQGKKVVERQAIA
ncbi:MAG: 23S rRNA (adenine(2503)-C(2))-methyltransferase RlmN [bacterium]|jgi:23S rRNA (adenine2503-C2)-methyltransferase|nr:23S rRNA (adenine(2503)-C(2))-methyltransferase RlmN [Candidatus Neomarinimicrobiota bacterium]HIL86071.1 23S rRNA (adenine(2503)-C(2))-methyltransferase RlmN [Candidatus Neomarinimicrobiota bacterium]